MAEIDNKENMEDILLQYILDNDLMIIKNIKGKLSK